MTNKEKYLDSLTGAVILNPISAKFQRKFKIH